MATYTSNKKILKRWDNGSLSGTWPGEAKVLRLRLRLFQQKFYGPEDGEDGGVLPCELFAAVSNCRPSPRRQPRSRIKRYGNYGIFRK